MAAPPLPPFLDEFVRNHPALWEAYSQLGKVAVESGPLDARTARLVKLGIAIGAGLEGGVHSHVRRGLAEGLNQEELEHVAILAITTIGWPSSIAALSWIEDVSGT